MAFDPYTATINLISTVTDAVGGERDRESSEYQKELDAVESKNRAILQAKNIPYYVLGGMFGLGIIALIAKNKRRVK